jgi:hypothetical protein
VTISVYAWGFVLAEQLPETLFDISAQVRLKKMSAAELERWQTSRPQLQHLQAPGQNFVSATPPDVKVTSAWAVWFRLEAASLEAAERQLRETMVPALEASLIALTAAPATVELLRLGEADSKGYLARPQSPFSLSATFRAFAVEPLASPASSELVDIHARASKPGTYQDLARAIVGAQTAELNGAGLRPLVAAALLGYFHVIELIAAKISKHRPEPDVSSVEKITAQVRRDLLRPGTAPQQARILRNAVQKLDRLEGRSLSERIALAGTALGVPEQEISKALALSKLRNTTLGHPSSEAFDADLGAHLPAAREGATAFFVAFFARPPT